MRAFSFDLEKIEKKKKFSSSSKTNTHLSKEIRKGERTRGEKSTEEKKSLYAVWSLFIDNYIDKRRCNLFSNLIIDRLSFRFSLKRHKTYCFDFLSPFHSMFLQRSVKISLFETSRKFSSMDFSRMINTPKRFIGFFSFFFSQMRNVKND